MHLASIEKYMAKVYNRAVVMHSIPKEYDLNHITKIISPRGKIQQIEKIDTNKKGPARYSALIITEDTDLSGSLLEKQAYLSKKHRRKSCGC